MLNLSIARPSALVRPLLALIILLVFLPAVAAQEGDDPIALRVGDEAATASEVERRFEIALRSLANSQGIPLSDDLRLQLRSFLPQFLEQRATEVVLLQEAAARGIAASEEAVEEVLDQVRGSVVPGQTYEELLVQTGFGDEAFLRTLIEESETINLLVEALRAEVEVDEDAIVAAYEANAASFAVPEQVCARHILLDTEADAQLALGDLVSGADFSLLAMDRSTGPSGPNGGDLGCFGRGQMVAPFEEAAFDAEVDIPSGPIETQFGYHLILVYDRQEAGTAPLEQVRGTLEQQVRDDAFNAMLDDLRAGTDVEMFPEVFAVDPEEDEGGEGE
jgi:peptidyl-prolyl cis-trans isomerase C